MSCGEPVWWNEAVGTIAELNDNEEPDINSIFMQGELINGGGRCGFNFDEQLKWANTPLSELPELSDLEYFRRNMIKGLCIPENYIVGNLSPPSPFQDCVRKPYVDATVIDTVDDLVNTFGQPGDLYLASDDALDNMSKLFSYTGENWVERVVEFDMFDISLVKDPLLDGCRLQLTDEDKYDRAMAGI